MIRRDFSALEGNTLLQGTTCIICIYVYCIYPYLRLTHPFASMKGDLRVINERSHLNIGISRLVITPDVWNGELIHFFNILYVGVFS